MDQRPDLTKRQPDPWEPLGQQGGGAFDPVTGQPTPGPAAYSAVDPYAAAPATEYQPPYPGYPPGYVAGQPPQLGYPPQLPPGYQPRPPPGYYPPGYQLVPMYAMAPPRPAKPGGAVAASVLAYVQSAFVLIGGIILFSGANGISWLDRGAGSEITVVAIVTVIAGALLIAGATTLLNRKPLLITIATVLCLAISLYFVIRLADFVDGAVLWVPILFAVLPIISLALSMGSDVRAWVRAGAHDQ